jgi:hypothetical protein
MDANPLYIPSLPQSQPPTIPKLQPLPFGRVVALTRTIYSQRFAAYFVPFALVSVPIAMLTSVLSGPSVDQLQALSDKSKLLQQSTSSTISQAQLQSVMSDYLKTLTPILSTVLVLIVVGLVMQLIRLVLVDCVLVYLTSEHMLGHRPTFQQGLSAVRSRWGAVILGQVGLYALLIGLSVALAFTLFLCGLGFGLLVYIALALGGLLTPVLVLEKISVPQGMSHAWGLGKGRLWALIGMVGITILLSFAVGVVVSFINGLLFSSTGSVNSLPVLALSGLVSGLGTALVGPIGLIGYTVLYYDARVRLEAFGEALTALNDPEAHPGDIQPPTGLNLGAFKGGDFINIALVTAGTIVFILIYTAISLSASAALR